MIDNDNQLYEKAMYRIDQLVDEVLDTCDTVASENDYERSWVLETFRTKFNKAKRSN